MTKIYNVYHRDAPADAIYVGRPTIVGNPYTHLPNSVKNPQIASVLVGSREEAVSLYRRYFEESMEKSESFRNFVHSLKGHDLVCWCAPKICHANVIAEYLDTLEKDTR